MLRCVDLWALRVPCARTCRLRQRLLLRCDRVAKRKDLRGEVAAVGEALLGLTAAVQDCRVVFPPEGSCDLVVGTFQRLADQPIAGHPWPGYPSRAAVGEQFGARKAERNRDVIDNLRRRDDGAREPERMHLAGDRIGLRYSAGEPATKNLAALGVVQRHTVPPANRALAGAKAASGEGNRDVIDRSEKKEPTGVELIAGT